MSNLTPEATELKYGVITAQYKCRNVVIDIRPIAITNISQNSKKHLNSELKKRAKSSPLF